MAQGSRSGDGGERGDSGAGAGGGSGASSFVAFVLEQVCGFDASTGTWARGSNVAPAEGRCAVTGETVKPRHLWTGRRGARLPVFLNGGRRLGVGHGRRIVSQVPGSPGPRIDDFDPHPLERPPVAGGENEAMPAHHGRDMGVGW